MANQSETKLNPRAVVSPISSSVDAFHQRDAQATIPNLKKPPDALSDVENETLDEIYILGQPPLEEYLYYIRKRVIDGDKKVALNDWRLANEYYRSLEKTEAGIADEIEVLDLDPELVPLAEEQITNPRYRNTFDDLPGQYAMVELDRLVVSQFHVTRQHTDMQQARLGPAPSAEAVFRFCQPPAASQAPVRARRIGSQRYIFSSESTDFRPHDPVLLRPDQVSDYESFGHVSNIVGLVVGFGSNFFSAIRYGDRLILHNGYHRAYALRALGVTHAPCIVKEAADRDELEVAAGRSVAANSGSYFDSKRPPVLKDFFDPRIFKIHRIRKTVSMIEIEFEIREYSVDV
jgi:hypothetical protein